MRACVQVVAGRVASIMACPSNVLGNLCWPEIGNAEC